MVGPDPLACFVRPVIPRLPVGLVGEVAREQVPTEGAGQDRDRADRGFAFQGAGPDEQDREGQRG